MAFNKGPDILTWASPVQDNLVQGKALIPKTGTLNPKPD